jgi:hypothetical protein
MSGKKQAAMSIDPKVWDKFKEKFKGKASQHVENYMKWQLGHEVKELPDLVFSDNIRSLSLSNPSQWSLNYTDNKLQLNNVSYSCSMGTNNISSDGSSAQMYTSAKDIEIE